MRKNEFDHPTLSIRSSGASSGDDVRILYAEGKVESIILTEVELTVSVILTVRETFN